MNTENPKRAFLSLGRMTALKAVFLFFFVCGLLSTNTAGATDGLRSFLKVAPPLVEPNVLFFLDSSGSMLWPMNAGADERTASTCTFGDGTLGWKESKHAFLQEFYGRDMDPNNNVSTDPDNYHPRLIWKRGGTSKADANDELMPNDSRAYKAKLVLWRILNDANLISGLRIAFGTYMQTFDGDRNVYADWYRYPHSKVPLNKYPDSSPGSVGNYDQANRYRKDDNGSYLDPTPYTGNISGYFNSWRIASGVIVGDNEESKRALLRSDFRVYARDGAVLDQTLLNNKLLKWINGAEHYGSAYLYPSNYHLGEPEIRFDGWRPLREVFANADDDNYTWGSSNEGIREGDFIDFFKMTNPKTITDYCQTNWVVLLTSGGQSYGTDDALIQSVKNLYNTSIKFSGKDSQPIKTLVLGFVDPQSTNAAVVALRNKLNRVADAGDNGVEDNSATAYFATDVPSIMSAMNRIIATIRAGSGTNNAPLPSPATGSGVDEIPSFYQSLYIGRADGHWRGDIVKRSFDEDTYPEIWSAAEKLQNTLWSSRKVYVPALDLEPTALTPAHENMTRLSTSLAASLAPVIGISAQGAGDAATLTSNFIQWFLGDNIYGEVERFKLFDILYSGVAKIGPPNARARLGDAAYTSFAALYKERPTLIYTQANAGLLHAFNDTDGTERWAFMPPNALVKGRLRGLKGDWVSDKWVYDTTLKSYPRYITDGPLIPADIQIEGEYRTVLLCLLGLGGAGMYAVDVTNVDMPRFLWALENDIYIDNAKNILTVEGQDIKKDNERKVRLWRQNGNLIQESALSEDDIDDAPQWDYENLRFTRSVPRIGNVMIDTDAGSVKQWVFIMGNGTPFGEASFSAGEVYVSNIQTGEIVRTFTPPQGVNAGFFVSPISALFEDSGRRIKTFFAADSQSGTVFKGDLSSGNPANWTFEDIFTVKTLPGVGAGNIGFAYTLKIEKFYGDYWLFGGTGDWLNLQGGAASTTNYFVAVNLKDLNTEHGNLTKLDPSDPLEIAPNNNGWYIEFGKDEHLSAPPTVYNGYVFFSTFTEGNDPCDPDVGTAKLYGVKGTTGKGALNGEGTKFFTFSDVRITGIAFMGDKILLGTSSSVNFANEGPLMTMDQSEEVKSASSDDGSIPAGTEIEGLPLPVPGSKEMLPFYWKGR
ncbi:MAG: hypothetical protein EOM12_11095 [Verrucomicrobiae bacterium]|nr:hypothetical protein [Verrucomicrobiae bacterium]